MPWLLSVWVLTFSGATGWKKLGHPVPESNFESEANSGRSHAARDHVIINLVALDQSPGRGVEVPRATHLPCRPSPDPRINDNPRAVRAEWAPCSDTPAFAEGATAEEIAQQYPSVPLADVYSIVGYYLRRRAEVDAYLWERRQLADQVRQQADTHADPAGIRERLLSRRAAGTS